MSHLNFVCETVVRVRGCIGMTTQKHQHCSPDHVKVVNILSTNVHLLCKKILGVLVLTCSTLSLHIEKIKFVNNSCIYLMGSTSCFSWFLWAIERGMGFNAPKYVLFGLCESCRGSRFYW